MIHRNSIKTGAGCTVTGSLRVRRAQTAVGRARTPRCPGIGDGGASPSPANRGRGRGRVPDSGQIGDGDGGASPSPGKSGTVPGTVPDCRRVPSSRTLIIAIIRWRCSAHFLSIPDTVITVNFWIPAFGLGVLVVVLCCCCQLADYCSAQSTRLRARRSRLH